MARRIDSLFDIGESFDVAVLDQWGVLHRGDGAFPAAIAAVSRLAQEGKHVVVLSNSGKRAAVNRRRIESLGFQESAIDHIVTSGEVAWQDLRADRYALGKAKSRALFPICASPRDARDWAGDGAGISFVDRLELARSILLMGLADEAEDDEFDEIFETAVRHETGMICTNPDTVSLRGERRIIGPGFLARRFADMGGKVAWYGKPFPKVFDAVRKLYPHIPRNRFLMIGDSIEHDIAGARRSRFLSLLVLSGVHESLANTTNNEHEPHHGIEDSASECNINSPDFCLEFLN